MVVSNQMHHCHRRAVGSLQRLRPGAVGAVDRSMPPEAATCQHCDASFLIHPSAPLKVHIRDSGNPACQIPGSSDAHWQTCRPLRWQACATPPPLPPPQPRPAGSGSPCRSQSTCNSASHRSHRCRSSSWSAFSASSCSANWLLCAASSALSSRFCCSSSRNRGLQQGKQGAGEWANAAAGVGPLGQNPSSLLLPNILVPRSVMRFCLLPPCLMCKPAAHRSTSSS